MSEFKLKREAKTFLKKLRFHCKNQFPTLGLKIIYFGIMSDSSIKNNR